MAPRVYFYKDADGSMHKYRYCTLCSAGPFKASDISIKYIETGSTHSQHYCMSCSRTLGFKALPKFTPEEKVIAPELIETPEEREEKEFIKRVRAEILTEHAVPVIGTFAVYIGQCADDSYVCGVTTDLAKEIYALNNTELPAGKKPPIEIVYYRSDDDQATANIVRSHIENFEDIQKELLIRTFEKSFF
jgi:predicted GIY-YIG superfamily endonuclease